jgi:hypothetical protein
MATRPVLARPPDEHVPAGGGEPTAESFQQDAPEEQSFRAGDQVEVYSQGCWVAATVAQLTKKDGIQLAVVTYTSSTGEHMSKHVTFGKLRYPASARPGASVAETAGAGAAGESIRRMCCCTSQPPAGPEPEQHSETETETETETSHAENAAAAAVGPSAAAVAPPIPQPAAEDADTAPSSVPRDPGAEGEGEEAPDRGGHGVASQALATAATVAAAAGDRGVLSSSAPPNPAATTAPHPATPPPAGRVDQQRGRRSSSSRQPRFAPRRQEGSAARSPEEVSASAGEPPLCLHVQRGDSAAFALFGGHVRHGCMSCG